jgi:hypothetical protein
MKHGGYSNTTLLPNEDATAFKKLHDEIFATTFFRPGRWKGRLSSISTAAIGMGTAKASKLTQSDRVSLVFEIYARQIW